MGSLPRRGGGGMFGGSRGQDGSMPSKQWEHGDKRDPHERNRKGSLLLAQGKRWMDERRT